MVDIIDDFKERLKEIGFVDPKIDRLVMDIRRDWHGERPYISQKNDYVQKLSARNRKIISEYKAGESITLLARRYGLSRQRVSKIING